MEKKFLFELITPSKTLVSNEFDMVESHKFPSYNNNHYHKN